MLRVFQFVELFLAKSQFPTLSMQQMFMVDNIEYNNTIIKQAAIFQHEGSYYTVNTNYDSRTSLSSCTVTFSANKCINNFSNTTFHNSVIHNAVFGHIKKCN